MASNPFSFHMKIGLITTYFVQGSIQSSGTQIVQNFALGTYYYYYYIISVSSGMLWMISYLILNF
jgi:hypothetical protein